MFENIQRKHKVCALIAIFLFCMVVGYVLYPVSQDGCGCGKSEGYVSPSLKSMQEKTKEGIYNPNSAYKPREGIQYANPVKQGFAPSMRQQMNTMRGQPVAKSMNSLSPFIN